jgi:hypothetical protein
MILELLHADQWSDRSKQVGEILLFVAQAKNI